VSIGSTPTAIAATDATGVSDVRAGNFVFFDLVMAGIGVCDVDDLALSVVVTVIGHQPDKGWVITDGGWMATSRDHQMDGHRYGLVADLAGNLLPDLTLAQANQEHGMLSIRPGSDAPLPHLRVGTRLRILPHHACATAAQHQEYRVIDNRAATGGPPPIRDTWRRVNGW
jgi:D-serine deaminase-like pyridoxal phosphate-dependent protein